MTSIRQDLKFTYDDYLLLPEDKRYELVDGDLYRMPSPRTYHQIVCAQIESKLRQFVEKKKSGIILHAPCDVYFSRYDVVQPDILFVAQTEPRCKPGLLMYVQHRGTKDTKGTKE